MKKAKERGWVKGKKAKRGGYQHTTVFSILVLEVLFIHPDTSIHGIDDRLSADSITHAAETLNGGRRLRIIRAEALEIPKVDQSLLGGLFTVLGGISLYDGLLGEVGPGVAQKCVEVQSKFSRHDCDRGQACKMKVRTSVRLSSRRPSN